MDPAKFKDFYQVVYVVLEATRQTPTDSILWVSSRLQFTFMYAKGAGQKSLDLEMAIAYWNIVLSGRFIHLDLWVRFLKVRRQS